MSFARVASTVDVSVSTPQGASTAPQQKPSTTYAPVIRPVQFTKEQLTSPDQLVKQFNALHQEIAQTSQSQRSHPEQAPITFKNVVCGIDGAKVILAHGFGRFADYIVVKWKSRPLPAATTINTHFFVCDEEEATATRRTDKNTLCLNSYVAGVANIRVFPGA